MPQLTDILLRSLMSQELPTPAGARLIVTVDALPHAIRDRIRHGDLRGLTWRAWSAEGRIAFMAAELVTARAAPRTPEILRALAVDDEHETRGLWRHVAGGKWERVHGPPVDTAPRG